MPRYLIYILLALPMVTGGCARNIDKNTSRPLAEANVEIQYNYERIKPVVFDFAHAENFAVGEDLIQPRGMLDFVIILYRDDIKIIISKVRNRHVSVSAYALCVCEVNERFGLQGAAKEAVGDLTERLAKA